MQAIILGCLLCLQTSNPCDSNQIQSISQDPSCTKCLTDLQDHFKLPSTNEIPLNTSTSPILSPSTPVDTDISSETIKILHDLLADAENIAQTMKENPHEVYDWINKIETEIRQGLQSEVQGAKQKHLSNESTIQRVQKQEHLLEKITSKFKSFFHDTEEILSRLSSMKKTLPNEENEEEVRRRRDSIMSGERLMAGDFLVSKNGKYKLLLSPVTAELIIYDRKGTELKKQSTCLDSKPISSQIHLEMGETLEYYSEVLDGKSTKLECSNGIPMGCELKDSKCFAKLDYDGYLKICKSSGEPVLTLF